MKVEKYFDFSKSFFSPLHDELKTTTENEQILLLCIRPFGLGLARDNGISLTVEFGDEMRFWYLY